MQIIFIVLAVSALNERKIVLETNNLAVQGLIMMCVTVDKLCTLILKISNWKLPYTNIQIILKTK